MEAQIIIFTRTGELNTRQKLEKYLIDNPIGKINTGELSRSLQVSRQLICSLLDSLGETRHKRSPQQQNYCLVCENSISKKATHCKTHSKVPKRNPGQHYQCKVCEEYKLLEEFAKTNRYRPTRLTTVRDYSETRYERRCLACRAKWQREYCKTKKEKENNMIISENNLCTIDVHGKVITECPKVFPNICEYESYLKEQLDHLKDLKLLDATMRTKSNHEDPKTTSTTNKTRNWSVSLVGKPKSGDPDNVINKIVLALNWPEVKAQNFVFYEESPILAKDLTKNQAVRLQYNCEEEDLKVIIECV